MKYIICAIILLMTGTAQAAKWELVWSDEFNYTGLPDKTKWNYETGFIRNHESQFYTKERLENVRVEDGNLVIEARKEHFANPNYVAGARGNRGQEFADYTSGSITTQGKIDWTYGRIEARLKVPAGAGTWPAFWMLGTDITKVSWPKCGEIDIMEFLGREGNQIHGTAHWFDETKKPTHQSKTATLKTTDAAENFHIYAVEWTPEKMDFFVDDAKYLSVNINDAGKGPENAFRKPQYLIFNLAIGGDWGGKIDDTKLPAKYLIDYVRIYRDKNIAAATQPAK